MKWIESFLRYVRYEKNYSFHTVLSYTHDLSQFADYLVQLEGGIVPEKAERDHVRRWMASLMEEDDSTRTVARKLSALRTFYRYLQKQGVVEKSPMRDIALPKIHKSLPTFVRPAEMDALLDEKVSDDDFPALRDHLILSILYMTGMRRAELVGLLDSDVDTQAMQFKVLGKRNKQRLIPFGQELKNEIESYRRARRKFVGADSPSFLVRDDGESLYPQYVYRLVNKRLAEVTTLSHRSPHVLRHSFASALLNDGAGLNSVKELLGHQSLASTQVYTHISFEELKRDYKQAHPRAIKKGGHYGS